MVCVALLGFGAAKLPFERGLEAQHRAAFFHGARLDLSLWERIGQMGFLAALSGFRAVVADGLYIDAHVAWEHTEWGRVKLDFDAVTALQPRCVLFWDQAAWHMAYNASAAALLNPKQPREALRIKAQREYWKLGEDYLLRGIANNPERPLLYDRLGFLYREKFQDHCKAARAYAECARLPKAPQYAHRFHAYELAQCPGHEREAYELLRSLYRRGEDERLPTLLRWLDYLQEKLSIPPDQRDYIPPRATP
ncbi:MAG: hypothetical protein QOE70_6096 [Chthoniobacter sp.]|nr:hypothetical protein [Chthoniobacter sp.]